MDASLIVGIISLIFALPGIVIAFSVPGYRAFTALSIAVGLGVFLLWRLLNSPAWTVIEIHRNVEIKATDGKLASATKKARIKANQKGLTEYLHTKIRSTGTICNFKLDSKAVPLHDIQKGTDGYAVSQRFPAVGRWQTIQCLLTYDLQDSFLDSHEFSGYIVDYPTKKCVIEVHFPSNRPARNPRAYMLTGAERKNLNSPVLNPNGTIITWEGHNLKPGSYYRVEWDW